MGAGTHFQGFFSTRRESAKKKPIGVKKGRFFEKKVGRRDVHTAKTWPELPDQSRSDGWCSSGAVPGQSCPINYFRLSGASPDPHAGD